MDPEEMDGMDLQQILKESLEKCRSLIAEFTSPEGMARFKRLLHTNVSTGFVSGPVSNFE